MAFPPRGGRGGRTARFRRSGLAARLAPRRDRIPADRSQRLRQLSGRGVVPQTLHAPRGVAGQAAVPPFRGHHGQIGGVGQWTLPRPALRRLPAGCGRYLARRRVRRGQCHRRACGQQRRSDVPARQTAGCAGFRLLRRHLPRLLAHRPQPGLHHRSQLRGSGGRGRALRLLRRRVGDLGQGADGCTRAQPFGPVVPGTGRL